MNYWKKSKMYRTAKDLLVDIKMPAIIKCEYRFYRGSEWLEFYYSNEKEFIYGIRYKKRKKKSSSISSEDMMAMINIIPVIVWAIVVFQRFCKGLGFWENLGIGIVFVFVYMLISIKPFVSLIPNIASTIMYVGMMWSLVNLIENDIARIVIIVAAFVGLHRKCIITTPTLKVLTKKMEKPKVVHKDATDYLV